jgi:ABC-type multidrug transport system fused ATPase/permease subunit
MFETICSHLKNTPGTNGTPPDNEVKHVLETVGLLPRVDGQGSLDAQLSKVGLSQGQLQLLSIAR